MEMLSKEYGWTPSQIREQSVDDINQYIEIINQKNKIAKANQIRAKK